MATDSEESDIDDLETPALPKRRCTQFVKVNETAREEDESSSEEKEMFQDIENITYDADYHANETLCRWQTSQVADGFVDNFINQITEDRTIEASFPSFLDACRYHLYKNNFYEDTAVMMATYHHGLVRAAGACHLYSDKAQASCPSNGIEGVSTFENSIATTSTDPVKLNNSSSIEAYNDESIKFLERAVAEAIKKKGLSALSIDYG
ncbi:PREDICTED: uncharacterized protein LOC107192706 [Dufourea novaeangliae]|uniref:uncharacterized protein LOC107192706 n=1 Tax=Dufourea novaeangliae TaxID=178035 RepID=UPI0007679CC9|nr:PREDICTED: uncharacterized protein LOC107192706 [Dufourea novaeangliae]